MNIGEAFLKRGEHPPSFVSLYTSSSLFTLSARFTYYILVWILKHVLLQVRRYISVKTHWKNIIQYLLKMIFVCSSFFCCENANASYLYRCNTANASPKRGKTFYYNNHWISHTMMIWWKICLLFPRLNGVLPTSLWSVAPSSTSSFVIYDCHIFILYFIARWALHLIVGYRRKQLYFAIYLLRRFGKLLFCSLPFKYINTFYFSTVWFFLNQ